MTDEIADVLVRYATGIDRRDWDLFRTCFTEDVEADYGEIGAWHGVEEITAWMTAIHDACGHTMHRITNVVAEISGDRATARSYVEALVLGPDDASGVRAAGWYDDELIRTDDGWRIARRRFTTAFVQPVGGGSVVDDIEAIKALKARYFRTMDQKDWAAYRQVFTDDVVIDTTESGGGVVEGADEFLVFLQDAIGDVVTVHHGHTPEIQVTSPTTATGVWAMEDWLRWPDGTELHGFGHYTDSYERVEGAWRIASSTLTRLRMDFTPPAAD